MVDDLDDDEPHPAHDASTNEDKNLETNGSGSEKQKQTVVWPCYAVLLTIFLKVHCSYTKLVGTWNSVRHNSFEQRPE